MRASPLLLAIWLIPVVSAADLVNGEFDEDLSGWSLPPGIVSAAWDPLDVDGALGSGSARLTNSGSGGNTGGGLEQCLAIVPGASYTVGGAAFIPTRQSGAGTATLLAIVRDGADCTGSFLANLGTRSVNSRFESGLWVSVSNTDVAPAGARSVLIQTRVTKFEAPSTFTAHFDGVFVLPEPATGTLQPTALLALLVLAVRSRH